MRFPELHASDLEGTKYTLPDDLPRGPRLIIIAFQRWHQLLVDGWQRALEPLLSTHPEISVWEVPTLSRGYLVARPFIDGGMRAGIPDVDVRRHTLTTYTDLGRVAATLGLETLETVHLFLIDGGGEIRWRGSGEPDADAAEQLAHAVEALGAEAR